MIFPPLFQLVAADAGVQSALGTNPVRVFPFGEAPDKTVLPYAVWQTVTGGPENYLGNLPDADAFVVQVDVYGSTPYSVRAAAEALRNAIETGVYITAWRGESKDFDTGRYRFSFDVEFLTLR